MNMNKRQKVFYFYRETHHFSNVSPLKLIYSPVWYVVKARRDKAIGHEHLHNFRANNITWKLWKWLNYEKTCHSLMSGKMTWSDVRLAALKTDERTSAYTAPDQGEVHVILSSEW